MVYELKDISKVEALFAGWQDTCIDSCLQGVMGKIFVTDPGAPRSAYAFAGSFAFYAGEPDRELVMHRPAGSVIMVPRDEHWAKLIEECLPGVKRVTRYAIRKDTVFDIEQLRKYAGELPPGYELRPIDAELYDQCPENPEISDFVSAFSGKEQYLELGRGMAVVKDGKIVAGASSYTRYREGIEIEVITLPEERRKHLALAACAALIIRCLEEGLYPSWDAANMGSVRLAEKLGYEFDREYPAYEFAPERGPEITEGEKT